MKKINSWYLPDEEAHLTKYIEKQDNYQSDCRYHALQFVNQFRNAIDIGAHIGLWARDLTRKFEFVYAFEPIPSHQECFKKNIERKNYKLIPYALGDKAGLVSFEYDRKNTGHTRVKEDGTNSHHTYEVFTLDSFCLVNIDFIKIDAEGFEPFILQGATQTIINNKPIINIEQKGFNFKGQQLDSGQKYLEGLGMKLLGRFKDEYVFSF